MFDRLQGISKVLIIDLDAHQVKMLIFILFYNFKKVMKEWVDMENFYRDSTRFHHEEAVWIISCWICFWLWVNTCIVIESIQISCYWPYRPSCFKYLMINLYLIQFLLKEVLIGTYIFVTRFLKNQAPVMFSGEWTWARLYGRQKSVHHGRL